jgi:hypothetical protein
MEDVRDSIDTLNLKPKFITIGTNIVISGWSLVKWGATNNSLQCKVFGYEECHPRYWRRFTQPSKVNLISHYRAIFIPRPAGMEARYHTLTEERYILRPQDPAFQHLTRIDRNKGYGYSRIQPIWDAITKLRERSDSDHFLKSNFMEVRYPQSWTASGKAKKFVDKARRATRRRGIAVEAVEAVTNPQTNEDTGLPSTQFRPWGQGPTGQPMDKNQATAYLDGEWLRLLVNLGYSQAWAVGAAAGAMEGSEINLTRDDRADIAEFSTLEPIYKDMLKRLAELGVMEAIGVSPESIELLLSKKYKMVSWLTWEYNDKAALQQEQLDHEMEMKRGESDDRNSYDKQNSSIRHNSKVEAMLLLCMRENKAMPMTPVMSSWLDKIGFEYNTLYMTTHDGYEYFKPMHGGQAEAEAEYYKWTDSGSKGGYFWDNFADRSPPWKRTTIPSSLTTGYGEDIGLGTPEETREFKMEGDMFVEGAGETREPLKFKEPLDISPPEYNPTHDPFAFAKEPKGKGRPRSPGAKAEGHVSRETERKMNPYGSKSPYPITYNEAFKAVMNSASALRRFAKNISTDHLPEGWGMRQDTPYKIKELVEALGTASTRLNRVSFGNSVKAGHPYNYGGEDEFICPQHYKANIGKKVPLGIYHNLEVPGKPYLPEWQVIGTHEVLGWDDELGQEIAKNEYDENKINEFFVKHNEENWIKPYLDAGQEPPISGAYTCGLKKHNGKNFQINIDLKSMSFVPDGNCPWDICNFKPKIEAEVIA